MKIQNPPFDKRFKFQALLEKMQKFVKDNKGKINEDVIWLQENYSNDKQAHKIINLMHNASRRKNFNSLGIIQVSKMGNDVYIKVDVRILSR